MPFFKLPIHKLNDFFETSGDMKSMEAHPPMSSDSEFVSVMTVTLYSAAVSPTVGHMPLTTKHVTIEEINI